MSTRNHQEHNNNTRQTFLEYSDLLYRAYQTHGLDQVERRIVNFIALEWLMYARGPNVSSLAGASGLAEETVRRRVARMIERGYLRRGDGREIRLADSDGFFSLLDASITATLSVANRMRHQR